MKFIMTIAFLLCFALINAQVNPSGAPSMPSTSDLAIWLKAAPKQKLPDSPLPESYDWLSDFRRIESVILMATETYIHDCAGRELLPDINTDLVNKVLFDRVPDLK